MGFQPSLGYIAISGLEWMASFYWYIRDLRFETAYNGITLTFSNLNK